MTLKPIIFALLVQQAPPGQTAFSVEPAADCKPTDAACEGAKWSDFYSTWVRRESAETGSSRYELIASTLVDEAAALLCRDGDGKRIDECDPYPGARTSKGRERWDVLTLSTLAAAVATIESGFREDVQVGRGWAKEASADGGMGRGPGMESCAVQAHPTIAWRFADIDEETRALAAAGDARAREAVMRSLLGHDEESLRRCWRVGLRMLIHARAYCSWAAPKAPWDQATIALYGTGTSCTSPNGGKTWTRVRLFRNMLATARAKQRKTREES